MSGNGYSITRRPFIGLLTTYHPRFGNQLWSRSKLTKKHKGDACAMCGKSVGDVAYRPAGNGQNRMMRICETCAGPAFDPTDRGNS